MEIMKPTGLKISESLSSSSATVGKPSSTESIQESIRKVLRAIGENPEREGLKRTPERYAKALQFLCSGYDTEISQIVGDALFEDDASEIVLIRDIELFSLCEHHLLPFYGRAHVAYIPDGKIIGLSKIPRIVDMFARRLQIQERLTTQISNALVDVLKPKGVAVIIEAFHLCVMMRGVEKQTSRTLTSSVQGVFRDNPTTRQEFLHLLGGLNTRSSF